MVEHLTFNQGVGSSSLPRLTSKSAGALDSLSDGFVAYKICAQAEGKSQRSIDWIIDIVGYFNEFLGNLNIEAITADDLRRFIIALQQRQAFANHRFTKPQNRPLSSETVASYTRAIKTFFSFLEREELIANNPMKKVKLPKTIKKNMPVFNEGDLEKLLAQPNKRSNEGYRNYVVMLTLLDTGIRVSELCNLKTSDVDLANGYLRVMGKGSKERYVPIGAKLTKALLKYLMTHGPEGCDSFFVTYDGRPLVKKRVQDLIKSYGKKADIKTRCSPHTFRSTSAVLYLRNGGDPFSLQKRLGHSSLTMTRRYSVLADSDVRAQHLKYGVVDKLKV